MRRIELKRIQPAGRVTVGRVAVKHIGRGQWGVVSGVSLVLAVPNFESAAPDTTKLSVDKSGDAAQLEISGRFGCAAKVVELVLTSLIDCAHADFNRVIKAVRKIQAKRTIAVSVVIAIGAETIARRVDTLGFIHRGPQVEASLAIPTGEVQAAFEGAVASRAEADRRCKPLTAALAGEDLHHAADGIRAIQRRPRAAHDFNPFDLIGA